MDIQFPAHKCGLRLEHNQHLSVYESLLEYLDSDFYSDMSAEDRTECLRTNELWTLQWYPETPVGFCVIHGPTLERVMQLANDGD